MSITLTSEQEQFVQEMIATGRYQKAEEVIQAAFELVEEHSVQYKQWLEKVRVKVEEGIASLEREEGIDGETFVAELLKRYASCE